MINRSYLWHIKLWVVKYNLAHPFPPPHPPHVEMHLWPTSHCPGVIYSSVQKEDSPYPPLLNHICQSCTFPLNQLHHHLLQLSSCLALLFPQPPQTTFYHLSLQSVVQQYLHTHSLWPWVIWKGAWLCPAPAPPPRKNEKFLLEIWFLLYIRIKMYVI